MTQQAPTNGKVRGKVKDAKQLQVQPQPQQVQPQPQQSQAPLAQYPQAPQSAQMGPQQMAGRAEIIAQGALNNVKSNVIELSACGMWGLALSMAIKALMPGTLNFLAITSVALMAVNWGIKATGNPNSPWVRRASWSVIGAAVMIWFQLRPLMATPDFLRGVFYPSPNAEQVQGQ